MLETVEKVLHPRIQFESQLPGKRQGIRQARTHVPEIGRQPWVVYPSTSGPDGVSLLTSEAISQSVSPVEVLVTIVLFTLIYLFIFVAYVRIMAHFIKKGPDDGETAVPAAAVAKDGA